MVHLFVIHGNVFTASVSVIEHSISAVGLLL